MTGALTKFTESFKVLYLGFVLIPKASSAVDTVRRIGGLRILIAPRKDKAPRCTYEGTDIGMWKGNTTTMSFASRYH